MVRWALVALAALIPGSGMGGPTAVDVAAARRQVEERINHARGELGLAPLERDARLELVGDAAAATLLEEGLVGHVARDGALPFVRWALAGGSGFHRENAASLETTSSLAGGRLGDALVGLTDGMLAEQPPHDGHRRALLDPTATHLGVGVAELDGRVRMNHQLATLVVTHWEPPPVAAAVGSWVRLQGRLPPTWRAVGLQIGRQELPTYSALPEVPVVLEFGYPPQVAMLPARAAGSEVSGPNLVVNEENAFSAAWQVGAGEGVEVAVLWARPRTRTGVAVPLAVAVTVVTAQGALPPHLARWVSLREAGAAGEAP